ncbi:hypothetical protein PSPO01_04777 [Paraphaeosphaeria sporulosa]
MYAQPFARETPILTLYPPRTHTLTKHSSLRPARKQAHPSTLCPESILKLSLGTNLTASAHEKNRLTARQDTANDSLSYTPAQASQLLGARPIHRPHTPSTPCVRSPEDPAARVQSSRCHVRAPWLTAQYPRPEGKVHRVVGLGLEIAGYREGICCTALHCTLGVRAEAEG